MIIKASRSVLFIAALLVTTATVALQVPAESPRDYRIKKVEYDPINVVQLESVVGIATHIVLDKDETYVTHAFGDPNGWEFAHKDNHYFVKPKEKNSDTNLTIVTDDRSYNIVLHVVETFSRSEDGSEIIRNVKTPWKERAATLQLAFDYPLKRAQERAEAVRKASVEKRFRTKRGYNNLDYTMSVTPADKHIAPLNVWDNRRFTYFRFAQNAELPNIYTVDADGRETTVERHMKEDAVNVVEIHKVAPKFVLRLGNSVVGVYNENYDPVGEPNTTRTASPYVKRVTQKGGNR